MAALLGLQQQSKGRIAADIDPLDRVHLHGDIQAHRLHSCDSWRIIRPQTRWLIIYRHILPREGLAPNRVGETVKLPQFSIAAKLYAIFALLATVTVGLAAGGVVNPRRQTALTDSSAPPFGAAMNVERVNGLIYAVVMERAASIIARMSRLPKSMPRRLLKFNERIDERAQGMAAEPQPRRRRRSFARVRQAHRAFQEFRRELVKRCTESELQAAPRMAATTKLTAAVHAR